MDELLLRRHRDLQQYWRARDYGAKSAARDAIMDRKAHVDMLLELPDGATSRTTSAFLTPDLLALAGPGTSCAVHEPDMCTSLSNAGSMACHDQDPLSVESRIMVNLPRSHSWSKPQEPMPRVQQQPMGIMPTMSSIPLTS